MLSFIFVSQTHSKHFSSSLPFDQPLHIWEVRSITFLRMHQFLCSLLLHLILEALRKPWEIPLNLGAQTSKQVFHKPFAPPQVTNYNTYMGGRWAVLNKITSYLKLNADPIDKLWRTWEDGNSIKQLPCAVYSWRSSKNLPSKEDYST